MKVALIFGGKSTEYEVSCLSAASILSNINGHEVTCIGITKKGEWFVTEASADEIRSGKWVDLDKKPISFDLTEKAFICEGKKIEIDVAFPIVHGRNGEDGRLQGLLEMFEIKYVGPGVLGSAACMDKITANRLFESVGIAHAEWFEAIKGVESVEQISKKVEAFGYPVFVKPSNAGSSVGITKCFDGSEISAAVDLAFENDSRIIIEKSIEEPWEIEVAVMGNEFPITSCTGRVCSSNEEIYDYDAKYLSGTSKTLIPSGLDCDVEKEVKELAVKAYKVCDCRGMSRVDFLIDKQGKIYINEINTLPGFTSISMFPALFIATGMTYSELIDKLLNYAAN